MSPRSFRGAGVSSGWRGKGWTSQEFREDHNEAERSLTSFFLPRSPAAKMAEERSLHESKLQKMEAEMKMVFQQKVNEKEAKLKQSEEELYARHREMKEALEKQRLELEDKKRRLESGRPLTPEKVRFPFSLVRLRRRSWIADASSPPLADEEEGLPPNLSPQHPPRPIPPFLFGSFAPGALTKLHPHDDHPPIYLFLFSVSFSAVVPPLLSLRTPPYRFIPPSLHAPFLTLFESSTLLVLRYWVPPLLPTAARPFCLNAASSSARRLDWVLLWNSPLCDTGVDLFHEASKEGSERSCARKDGNRALFDESRGTISSSSPGAIKSPQLHAPHSLLCLPSLGRLKRRQSQT